MWLIGKRLNLVNCRPGYRTVRLSDPRLLESCPQPSESCRLRDVRIRDYLTRRTIRLRMQPTRLPNPALRRPELRSQAPGPRVCPTGRGERSKRHCDVLGKAGTPRRSKLCKTRASSTHTQKACRPDFNAVAALFSRGHLKDLVAADITRESPKPSPGQQVCREYPTTCPRRVGPNVARIQPSAGHGTARGIYEGQLHARRERRRADEPSRQPGNTAG